MPLEDFIIWTYCLIDDWYKKLPHPLRQRGFSPAFSDAEVVTLEIVAEFLGYEQDKQAWEYFHRHWLEWFPKLPSRSTYVRQSANLWAMKQQLQADLCREMDVLKNNVHRVDGLPMKLCNFRRANHCRLFETQASYGYCASKDQHYYGFQAVLLVSAYGVVTGITVMPANLDEAEGVFDCLTAGQTGLMPGDKGFIRPILKAGLQAVGLNLQTPLRRNMKDTRPPEVVKELMRERRLVETVIGQLTERFHIQRIRARDTWHLTVRVIRKVLSHTVAVFFNRMLGNTPLQLVNLIV
jgi:hypothetical protein